MAIRRFPLIDARIIEDTHFLARELGALSLKSSPPLLSPGQAYGTVLRDAAGQWRMYYLNGNYYYNSEFKADRYQYREAMATSADGLHWEQPNLGLIESDGTTANNMMLGMNCQDAGGAYLTGLSGPEGFCILDATTTLVPHARGRYTALYLSNPLDRHNGLCLAHSEDGVHWTAYPENPLVPGWHDTSACFFYDPRTQQYAIYTRPPIHAGPAGANRKVARLASPDLIRWSLPQVVLDTDDLDAPASPETLHEKGMTTPRGRDKQFYGITAFPYAELYLGLAWMYDVVPGMIGIELVHSYDGIDWRREPLRPLYLTVNRPEGLRGNMFVTMSNPPIAVGEELWIYFSGTDRTHHVPPDPTKPRDVRIELAALPRDRWIGYSAGDREGFLLSKPFDWPAGGRLALNASVEAGGEIRVEFCDELGQKMTGQHLGEIAPLAGPADSVSIPVAAGPGAGVSAKTVLSMPTRGPVRLRVAMKRARLFGWSVQAP